MKLFQIGTGAQQCQILLFGLGLIGSAIDRALRLQLNIEGKLQAYDWQDSTRRRVQRSAISGALSRAEGRLVFVWAGGRSGFSSTIEDMDRETAIVEELVILARQVKERSPDAVVEFHMLSSAGGLFEGQTHCGASSLPTPLRAYGSGKLAQEALLLSAVELEVRHIYRPSSVYGITGSRRVGLIAALIGDALKGATTRISGNLNTLRDYVLVNDIGRFIAGRICMPERGGACVHLLAAGRPAAVHEIIDLVARCIDAPLKLQFEPHPTNAHNMSYMAAALPKGWTSTSLATGVALTAATVRRRLG